MLNFLSVNWDSILLVLIMVLGMLFLWYRGKKDIVINIIKAAVTEAEKIFGEGTGKAKLEYAISFVYPKLPSIVRLVVTEKALTNLIEKVLSDVKEEWENNKNIQEYFRG